MPLSLSTWCKNLDVLVLQIKNWFDDPIVGFEA
jgi:hypothetical protein